MACEQIWQENQKGILQQSEKLSSMHHTAAHAQDVSQRANYLFNHLNLSHNKSPKDKAYAAIRELYIRSHDLIQHNGAVNNEIETKNTFNLYTPFEALKQEMLITGMCDRTPACCEELITMIYDSPLGLRERALQILSEHNPLLTFLNHPETKRPYPHANETRNLLTSLITMSPHQGMSIELSILRDPKVIETLFALKALQAPHEASQPSISFILATNQANQLFQKQKNKTLSVLEKKALDKYSLSLALKKNNDARGLRQIIKQLKHQVWHTEPTAPRLFFLSKSN